MPIQQMFLGAGGKIGPVYVDDVFQLDAYTGYVANRRIADKLDIETEGGFFWIKCLSNAEDHWIADSERGITKRFEIDNQLGYDVSGSLTYPGSGKGVLLGQDDAINYASREFLAQSFRRAKGFIDIVKYTGNATNRTIAHNLDSVPGCIVIKCISSAQNFVVYHKSQGVSDGGVGKDYISYLNKNDAGMAHSMWQSTAPTSTHFSIVSNNSNVNTNNEEYIAYLFADNDERFGPNEDKAIIKCGHWDGPGAVFSWDGLGWEPQWILFRKWTGTEDWYVLNTLAPQWGEDVKTYFIKPNEDDAEDYWSSASPTETIFPRKDGLYFNDAYPPFNDYPGNKDYIYIAIRTPDGYVGKPPEAGTEVFTIDQSSGTAPQFDSGFPVDFALTRKTSSESWHIANRSRPGYKQFIDTTAAETTHNGHEGFNYHDKWGSGTWDANYISWMWKRQAGFFDYTCYKGRAGSDVVCKHNLGVVPEMVWIWPRNGTGYDKYVYHKGLNGGTDPLDWWIKLNGSNPNYNSGNPWSAISSTSITLPSLSNIATNRWDGSLYGEFIAYFFASVEGVSKLGSWTGSSSNQSITLGFNARFVLIKRTDDTGDWLVFDSVRGIGGGDGYGEQIFTTTGSHSWTCPSGVTSVSVVCVGGGGEGGKVTTHDTSGAGGGALAYKNNISVTPGSSYTVVVGAGGNNSNMTGENGGASSFTHSGGTLSAGGGSGSQANGGSAGGGGTPSGHDGGGNGGSGGNANAAQGGGGGAGGYSGNGGTGLSSYPGSSGAGSGGAGGGGYQSRGGGVGLGGEGASGAAVSSGNLGNARSGGVDGGYNSGGTYGGGGRGGSGDGADGAVRIVWCTGSDTRSFPSTNVGFGKYLKLNTDDSEVIDTRISLSSTALTLTGGDTLTNVNTAKYIYYAIA